MATSRPAVEVADIFRAHGAARRRAQAGHLSLGQLKVMSAIEACRTAMSRAARTVPILGSPTTRGRNRHCPKCQGAAARDWLAAREAELLPVPYFHVVRTLPARVADIAYQNKAVVYDILFKGEPPNAIGSREAANAETLLGIAAERKPLAARIGLTGVRHSWGSALTHHPHLHMILPGGGISLARGEEGASPTGIEKTARWVSCRPGFFLSVRVLSRLFRRLSLEKLRAAHSAGRLRFFTDLVHLAERDAFAVISASILLSWDSPISPQAILA